MELLGVGAAEALVVFVLILILVGPQRFPELMRQGGRYYRIARGYTSEVMKDVRAAVDELEQEVKEETDLQSIRELSDVGREIEEDLGNTRRELDATGADTRTAAESVAENERSAPRPISSARSAGSTRPSQRTPRSSSAANEAAAASPEQPLAITTKRADEAETAPRAPRAAEPTAAPRVTLPEDDPFRALEARRAAAQRAPDDEDEGERADA